MSTGQEISVRQDDQGVTWITIDRAHKHNALAVSVLADLANAVTNAGASPLTKLILIKGAGERFFAAGGDLLQLSTVRSADDTNAMADQACNALDAVRNCPIPVLAYLNGDAIGGGAELAVACDMRLQASHARIGYIQARLAITSAWGGGSDLFTLVGAARAMRMMTRCEMVTPEQALNWGLADAEITDGDNGQDIQDFLKPMLACSRHVLEGIKAQAIAWQSGQTLSERRDVERDQLLKTWLHADHWAASDRFLMKGKQ